jgi:antitoxin (DNA-binding transcriptional repressor) of toxin-antitoxin stability system
MTITIDKAQQDLTTILSQLKPGESATLVDGDGKPVAMLISLKADPCEKKLTPTEWMAQWEALTQEIGRAWKGDKSAVETLLEMRR